MPSACRLGDPIKCGDTMAEGSPNVFVNGLPWTRVGPDKTAGHVVGSKFFPPIAITAGSADVFINGFPAARVDDPTELHPTTGTHSSTVDVGSPDVNANL